MSPVLFNNGIVYVTGHVLADRSQALEGQTQQYLDRSEHLLPLAGTDQSKVLFAENLPGGHKARFCEDEFNLGGIGA